MRATVTCLQRLHGFLSIPNGNSYLRYPNILKAVKNGSKFSTVVVVIVLVFILVLSYVTNANKLEHQIKVGLSPFQKNLFHLHHCKPIKNDEKCFLFHLKSSFRSQDI